ncbi:unnamed protein product [Cylicocyclus nassatus]|uniref:Uncharacterized protein n=1 Tax=Cylicocyclus nassatus TaxID=53992 RepID=A0AA36H0M2_CYLNA|nr:unnamed protein product [Cylicocyclus nassatus]
MGDKSPRTLCRPPPRNSRNNRRRIAAVKPSLKTDKAEDTQAPKVLGIQWETARDKLVIRCNTPRIGDYKTHSLKDEATIYDSLGWLLPLHNREQEVEERIDAPDDTPTQKQQPDANERRTNQNHEQNLHALPENILQIRGVGKKVGKHAELLLEAQINTVVQLQKQKSEPKEEEAKEDTLDIADEQNTLILLGNYDVHQAPPECAGSQHPINVGQRSIRRYKRGAGLMTNQSYHFAGH